MGKKDKTQETEQTPSEEIIPAPEAILPEEINQPEEIKPEMPAEVLVRMFKGEEEIDVHPTAVDNHTKLGWIVKK